MNAKQKKKAQHANKNTDVSCNKNQQVCISNLTTSDLYLAASVLELRQADERGKVNEEKAATIMKFLVQSDAFSSSEAFKEAVKKYVEQNPESVDEMFSNDSYFPHNLQPWVKFAIMRTADGCLSSDAPRAYLASNNPLPGLENAVKQLKLLKIHKFWDIFNQTYLFLNTTTQSFCCKGNKCWSDPFIYEKV